MIGKIECHLLLARRVGLVITIVSTDSHDTLFACRTAQIGEVDVNGQIATFMLLYLLSVDIDSLLAHDGLKVKDCIAPSTFIR